MTTYGFTNSTVLSKATKNHYGKIFSAGPEFNQKGTN